MAKTLASCFVCSVIILAAGWIYKKQQLTCIEEPHVLIALLGARSPKMY